MKYIDPDGREQNVAQKVFTKFLNWISKIDAIGNFVQKHTTVEITRDVYQGHEITDSWPSWGYSGTEVYYEDNLSVKFFGIELNNIQVQSVADHPSGIDDTMEVGRNASAEIGKSGATKAYITDTLLFDNTGNFLHRVWSPGRKPGSEGCAVTMNAEDEREVMNILRNDLYFTNDQTVNYQISQSRSDRRKNLNE